MTRSKYAWESQLLSLSSRGCELQQEKPLQQEARMLQLEGSPHSPQLEKACTQQQRPSEAKNETK